MKYIFIRFQLILVSIVLFLTMAMMMAIVMKFNKRWDFTHEKIYSLSPSTTKLLQTMKSGKMEVLAFYPHDDPSRANFEIFLKQCQLHHPDFSFKFYDPDRVPKLAGDLHVKEFYTILVRYGGRTERIIGPTEESFTNALLRLSSPQKFGVCFVLGHDEASISSRERNGLSTFRQSLENSNYSIHEIVLLRDKVPPFCNVLAVTGPHQDLDPEEYSMIKQTFNEGKGVLFLVDPMDPGTGRSFPDFMKYFGVALGEDVVVDKMSRLVGGDFLMPLVAQYVAAHPITEHFNKPTFYPVVRSAQPSTDSKPDIEAVPLALTSSGSWAESNLASLEKGEAAFDSEHDVSGPISIAVASEKKIEGAPTGRIVVVGDSDFLVNSYIGLSGNNDLALNMVRWLSHDDRFIDIQPRQPEFKPLFLSAHQRLVLVGVLLGALPLAFFFLGSAKVMMRRRSV